MAQEFFYKETGRGQATIKEKCSKKNPCKGFGFSIKFNKNHAEKKPPFVFSVNERKIAEIWGF